MRGSWLSPRPVLWQPMLYKPIKPSAGLWLRELLAHQAREGKRNSRERERSKNTRGPGLHFSTSAMGVLPPLPPTGCDRDPCFRRRNEV